MAKYTEKQKLDAVKAYETGAAAQSNLETRSVWREICAVPRGVSEIKRGPGRPRQEAAASSSG